MTPAFVTRLMVYADHSTPKEYGGSDMMRADLKELLKLLKAVSATALPALLSQSPTEFAMMQALIKACQLADVATDWNLEEVEIDEEMVSVRDLKAEFLAALNGVAA